MQLHEHYVASPASMRTKTTRTAAKGMFSRNAYVDDNIAGVYEGTTTAASAANDETKCFKSRL